MEYTYIKNSQGRLCKSFYHIPEGWKPLMGTWTEPKGYKWYWNGKGLFNQGYDAALIKTD